MTSTTFSPSKTNIQEANKHLQMLHGRVEVLERTLSKQSSDFAQRDHDRQIHFEELIKIKDAEILNLRDKVLRSEITMKDLTEKLKHKEDIIGELKDKSRVFDEIMKCKPILESLVNLMNVYQEYSGPEDGFLSEHQLQNGVIPSAINSHQHKHSSALTNAKSKSRESKKFTKSEDPTMKKSNSEGNTTEHEQNSNQHYL